MTVYRYECHNCKEYISSTSNNIYDDITEFWADWNDDIERFLEGHCCGCYDPDKPHTCKST